MAYMHKETFDIVVENSVKNPDDYFYIDELIALPIQILNRKGYTTKFCCAGHPFDWLGENGVFSDRSEQENAEILAARKTYKSFNCYILFKEGISLPAIPAGFSQLPFGELNITRDYGNMNYIYKGSPVTAGGLTFMNPQISDNDVYKFMRDVIEIMEQLYEWALNLPDFKDSEE